MPSCRDAAWAARAGLRWHRWHAYSLHKPARHSSHSTQEETEDGEVIYSSVSQRQLLRGFQGGLPGASQRHSRAPGYRCFLSEAPLAASNWSSALYFSTKALWEKAGLRRSPQMLYVPP